uniref:VASt domain-containing protein n=1 Tax=Setaria digitata TaxID=48799 RepID=A0A915PNU6_9BILA
MLQQQQRRLASKPGNGSTDDIGDNNDMDKIYIESEELLSETTCKSLSLTSLITTTTATTTTTTMNGLPDSGFPTDNSDTKHECRVNDSDNAGSSIETKVPCECKSHLGRLFLDEVYPLTTEQLFHLLFSSIPWYHHFKEIVKKTDYVATSWTTDNSAVTTRTVTYNMALNNALGPKSTSVTEKQTCYEFHSSNDGFSVTQETYNAGVPCADNFLVQCTYCVIRASNTHSRLLIHGAMIQKKSIWGIVKGIIEKSTYNGLEIYYSALDETLKLLCDNQGGSILPKHALERVERIDDHDNDNYNNASGV